MTRVEKSANGSTAGDLDFSCGGLLLLIAPLEAAPAIHDDRSDVWLTRAEVRTASVHLGETKGQRSPARGCRRVRRRPALHSVTEPGLFEA